MPKQLSEYRRKRHFQRTPEPSGVDAKASKSRVRDRRPCFVIQKHDASHLHYDLRLEWGGVLKSWALPKGPSLDPDQRVLAVQVEDHPIEYAKFEGIIPEGEYGGGTVMVWDRGHWEPDECVDPDVAFEQGKLSFTIHADKLNGRWLLVRMRPRSGSSSKPQWLFRKIKDEHARPADAFDIREKEPDSAASGRTMDEIRDQKTATWRSDRAAKKPVKSAPPARSPRARTAPKARPAAPDPGNLEGAVAAAMPTRLEPQLATPVTTAPAGDVWVHEIKFDGYRLLAIVRNGKVRLVTRAGNDWSDRFPALQQAIADLALDQAIIDGELVALDERGVSRFQLLQSAIKGDQSQLMFFAFDLLYLDGFDLRRCTLQVRRQTLADLLQRRSPAGAGMVRFSQTVEGPGSTVLSEACRLRLEGVVSKRLDAPYVSGRTQTWVKSKCINRQEAVIVGYTDPRRSRQGLGALLLGYFRDGELRFAGKVGTGFSAAQLQSIKARLTPLERSDSPFPSSVRDPLFRSAHWVNPVLVAEVEFTEWTKDGRMRHPSFIGFREDKAAAEVVREKPVPMTRIAARSRRAASPRQPRTSHAGDTKPKDPDVLGVTITHPDRVLFPEMDVRKIDLAHYYEKIAARMMPHVLNRPIVAVRCPQGTQAKCFYQKHWEDEPPAGAHTITIAEADKHSPYLVIDEPAGLISLVQRGVLEIHTWGSLEADLERPDRVTFDLDPGEALPWSALVAAAQQVRAFLKSLGLVSFVKTSGGKGLHIVAPLTPHADWDEVKAFSKQVADELARESPGQYTANMAKSQRPGRIFIDYLRNGRGATAVAAYSTRARSGVPVSMPLDWKELDAAESLPRFSLVEALARRRRDPWRDYHDVARAQQIKTNLPVAQHQ